MRTIILRFRDLSIPDGETIRRHRESISVFGDTWWGWIMRQRESYPEQLFITLAQRLKEQPQSIYLFHSGEVTLYPAQLKRISAFPGGMKLQSPDVQRTPPYMTEAECPAWFQLSKIDAPIQTASTLSITSFPTLLTPAPPDLELLGTQK
jgi:hypothetical protein